MVTPHEEIKKQILLIYNSNPERSNDPTEKKENFANNFLVQLKYLIIDNTISEIKHNELSKNILKLSEISEEAENQIKTLFSFNLMIETHISINNHFSHLEKNY